MHEVRSFCKRLLVVPFGGKVAVSGENAKGKVKYVRFLDIPVCFFFEQERLYYSVLPESPYIVLRDLAARLCANNSNVSPSL